jgi:HD domain
MDMNATTTVGTIDWTTRTGGRLTPAERRRLVADLARAHAGNAVGRFALLVRMNRGRNAYVAPERLAPPDSRLTQAARDTAMAVLPGTLLNHSHRTYVFGRALGELEQLDVDAELLFAAAMLHDVGLAYASGREDFTLTSARVAREVSERVGLSTAATATLETAITMHHSPRVTVAAGPVAYLLASGAGVDVAGLRCWDLPLSTLVGAVEAHPRDGFKEYFTQAWAREAARVPQGRAALLRRYGAFAAAIALAPFDE